MLLRTFVFRVYPSTQQLARLAGWEGALRFVWNLAHHQRLLGLARSDKRFPSWFDQKKELTLLRAEVDWLNDLPANAGQALLAHLDDAWRDFFAGKKSKPKFKRKGRDAVRIEEPSLLCWRLDTHRALVRFPKLGNLPVVLHRELTGTPKICRLVRDVDQWFVQIVCEVEALSHVHEAGPVAIDVGVEVALADSDGALVPNPHLGAAMAPVLAKRQRQLSKKQKGSKNQAKAREKVARVHRKLRRQRDHFLQTQAYRYAKRHSVVVVEALRVKNMTASAAGTEQEPGKNVRQKAGLNRSLLDVAPHRFKTLLKAKAAKYGGQVVEVPAAYSSQECAECGHIAAENRPSRSEFLCRRCGHEAHADTNAARVQLKRYNTRRTGGEAACGGNPEGGPLKQEPKPARARTKARKAKAKSLGHLAEDGLRMRGGCFPKPGA